MTFKNYFCLFMFVVSVAVFAEGNDKNEIEYTDLFVRHENGYNTYRIPSIIRTNKGTLLAFCEGRKDGVGDEGDIDLLMKRSEDNGESWSKQVVIWDDGDNTCGNPCPVVDRQTGTIWLGLTWNYGSDHLKGIVAGESKHPRIPYISKSEDDGLTWTKPNNISDSVRRDYWRWYATGPGTGIQLKYGKKKGRLVIPANHTISCEYKKFQQGAHVIYSDDHGKTWKLSDVARPGLNESQVVELLDGKVLLNSRNSRYRGSRALSFSTNCGETWDYVSYKSNLNEPTCQASIIRYAPNKNNDKDIILFSNPDSKKRTNMTVRVSYDGAKTWSHKRTIHEGPAAYSSLTVLDNGKIACLYEGGKGFRYSKIIFSKFTLDWIIDGKK
ncbi:Sialidase precursor [Sedimentisphaera cyanobacteriorum]|uniref:exo-alpha-sialidase n=1 Tax=Sedimentisphaera cyanobacteriorum TaxID=1940790 RepID=A0A1Q2HPF5_9BACT|nr:sialidase family protein [Sedimentisphaera cyanobacteriorum]AQQ09113.1 Sialidase precursor [Sedimentisphaera cyanobacteriorum]